jgi:hypothetical protein
LQNLNEEQYNKIKAIESKETLPEELLSAGPARVLLQKMITAEMEFKDIKLLRGGVACPVHRTCARVADENPSKVVLSRVISPGPNASTIDSMVDSSLVSEVNSTPSDIIYTSCAKVLFVGIGADEQMAGYGRHRTAFTKRGICGLASELTLDMNRLWKRNLVSIIYCLCNKCSCRSLMRRILCREEMIDVYRIMEKRGDIHF